VTGRVALRKLNLDGDRQADLSVHGGADKAVYCYPVAHYDYGRRYCQVATCRLACSENTLRSMVCRRTRSTSATGSIGSAEIVVTQPRLPC